MKNQNSKSFDSAGINLKEKLLWKVRGQVFTQVGEQVNNPVSNRIFAHVYRLVSPRVLSNIKMKIDDEKSE